MKILTLNVFTVPFRSTSKNVRISLLIKEIEEIQPDIILLQEVVFGRDKIIIEEKIHSIGYNSIPAIKTFVIPGGLVAFSKIPISIPQFIKFKNQGSYLDLTITDRILGKGFQIFKINYKNKDIFIINTHLIADYWSYTKDTFNKYIDSQINQIISWIKINIPDKEFIIAGDFNFSPTSPHYLKIINELNITDSLDRSLDPTVNIQNFNRRFSPKINVREDFIFYKLFSPKNIRSEIILNKPLTFNGNDYYISDHYGILFEF